jgi:two-component system, cell cycle sensor histidine kinase and response regulator CckA
MDMPIRLLLVEDDEEDYLLTGKLLRDGGPSKFQVKWVQNYEAALHELRNPYSICLVDYHLGAQSGVALIQRAIHDGFAGPMILLTGQGNHGLDVEAMRAGAADYLVKGQTSPQLMERVIRHSIHRKEAEAALRSREEQLRQAQKMEAIGRLAGGVAHDFNNLLSVILGYSELLTDGLEANDPLRSDLEAIHEAGSRAAQLTRHLLAYSRQQVLKPTALNLNDIVTGMEKMLRRLIGEDLDLNMLLGRDLPNITADPGQLEQVLMNLALNARDAMPHGGTLTIETAAVALNAELISHGLDEKVGGYNMLAVSDTGIGMDEATQGRIFEPFFSTKASGQGTGLGLATVFGVVKQSGGTILVKSEPGKGTTFRAYFPFPVDHVAVPPRPSSFPSTMGGLGGSETILLVEDEPLVRAVAGTILRKRGYDVLEAEGAIDALLQVEHHPGPIHLLLTDVVMPRMSGRQLAERMHTLRPGVKVLYMSGYTDDAVMRHGILDATLRFIQKPLTPDALAQKVRDVLDAPCYSTN